MPIAAEEAVGPAEMKSNRKTAELEIATLPQDSEAPAMPVDEKAQPEPAKKFSPSNTISAKVRETQTTTPGTKTFAEAGPGSGRAGGKARERLHRASTAARGAIEGNVKRVERIRQVSSVVLEEAHYDASLRFVLVAVVLFVIVTVLLVLTKVMG